jgi:hypothetical protein
MLSSSVTARALTVAVPPLPNEHCYQQNCQHTRRTVPNDAPFTPYAGHVGGFGVLVDGIGRGLPRSIACGKEYTVVATFPYEGPVMDVALQLMEEFAMEEEELQLLQQEVRFVQLLAG